MRRLGSLQQLPSTESTTRGETLGSASSALARSGRSARSRPTRDPSPHAIDNAIAARAALLPSTPLSISSSPERPTNELSYAHGIMSQHGRTNKHAQTTDARVRTCLPPGGWPPILWVRCASLVRLRRCVLSPSTACVHGARPLQCASSGGRGRSWRRPRGGRASSHQSGLRGMRGAGRSRCTAATPSGSAGAVSHG